MLLQQTLLNVLLEYYYAYSYWLANCFIFWSSKASDVWYEIFYILPIAYHDYNTQNLSWYDNDHMHTYGDI